MPSGGVERLKRAFLVRTVKSDKFPAHPPTCIGTLSTVI